MDMKSKEDVLKVVAAWLESASVPQSMDRELRLRKASFVKDASGQISTVVFSVEAATSVGNAQVPVTTLVVPENKVVL